MLAIRLQRVGRIKSPSFRVVVIDSHRAAKARTYREMVGSYNPRTKEIELNAERISHWISQGAQPSATVHNMLVRKNILNGPKKNVLSRRMTPRKEEEMVADNKLESPMATTATPGGILSEERSVPEVAVEVATEASERDSSEK